MSKRKGTSDGKKKFTGEESSSDEEDTDMLNVDFEFFDPQPDVDFHGLKTLLRQLLDVDAQVVDLSALADLILSQPLLGSTVKVEGNETDPYAFLTILNIREHKDKPAIHSLMNYLSQQSKRTPALEAVLTLLHTASNAEVGLVLTERLINIPAEVVAPMYKMLLEEITWAVEDKEPYTFTHYLILSKTYEEVQSKLDQEDSRPQKKKKKDKLDGAEVFYFHPEDEVLHRHSLAFGNYPYLNEESGSQADSKRAFQDIGIKPQGHMILIEAAKFEGAVQALEDFLRP